MDLLDASSSMFMMGLGEGQPQLLMVRVITHSSPLGISAHFKAERDIILFDMDIVVGRDKL